jgi:hypothetical protein
MLHVLSAGIASSVLGCGPLGPRPLPARLDVAEQQSIDEAWRSAFEPAQRLNRQNILDVLLLSQAYQVGVDRLSFRSEKDLPNGKIVMRVEFERTHPERDRFDVSVYDATGVLLRSETFDRATIDEAYKTLGPRHEALSSLRKRGNATPEELEELGRIEERIEAANRLLPANWRDVLRRTRDAK